MKYLKEDTINSESFFYNKKVVLTGTLHKIGRKEATALLESMGAKVAGSVSEVTDLVIVGEDAGSKFEKAKQLGVKTITEDEFEELLKKEGE